MLRAAIVGLGWWGRSLVSAVQGKSEEIGFVAAHTRTPAKAAEFCRENNIPLVASLDAILANPAIDAIAFATPHSQHAAQVIEAAAAGKHVFVEKPFTLDGASAGAAMEAARKAGIVLAVGFNRRFHPSMRELKARVASGRLGPIATLVGEQTALAGLTLPTESWRTNPAETPAAAMTGIGVHLVDAAIDLMGPIREVYCVTARRAAPHVDDATSILLTFASGATGLLFCSIAATPNFRMAVYGSQGLAEVCNQNLGLFRFLPAPEGGHGGTAAPPEIIETPKFNMLNAELTQFARSIRDKTPYPIPLAEIRHGVAVFEAVVRSAKTKTPVSVT